MNSRLLLIVAITLFNFFDAYASKKDSTLMFNHFQLLEGDFEKLLRASEQSDDNLTLILKLKEEFPDLYFLTLNEPLTEPWASPISIDYTDSGFTNKQASDLRRLFSEKYYGETAGYTFKGAKFNWSPNGGRGDPYVAPHHTIIIRSNVNRETILHEFLHYLIWRANNANFSFKARENGRNWLRRTFAEKTGLDIMLLWEFEISLKLGHMPSSIWTLFRGTEGQHIDISVLLLRFADEFKLSEVERRRTRELLVNFYFGEVKTAVFWTRQEVEQSLLEFGAHKYFKTLWPHIESTICEISDAILAINEEFDLGYNFDRTGQEISLQCQR